MHKRPPKFALSFLRWFCREDFIEEIEGDLVELFESQFNQQPRMANWLFFWRVLHYFRPAFIKTFSNNPFIPFGMFKHNIIVTYRGFLRNKTSFFINLLGLSTGLACFMMIYLWVNDELKIDKFHEKDDQLYQVLLNLELSQGLSTRDITPVPLAEALSEEFPEVEMAVTVNDFFNWHTPEGILKAGEKQLSGKGLIAGEDFFKVFSYPLLEGNKDKVLTDKNAIVISENMALKLFNSTNVIGKTIEWSHTAFSGTYQISGVYKTPPSYSTQQFDFLFHLDMLIDNDQWAYRWTGSAANTYIILKKGTDVKAFNKKIKNLLSEKDKIMKYSTLYAQKYSQKYLHGRYENGISVGGRIQYVRLFSLIAIFILLIACINFMNLSTAQSSKRMKEIGVKKAIGANRSTLIFQFLSESTIMAFISLLVGLMIVFSLLPTFNEFTGKQLTLDLELNKWIIIGGLTLVTGLISGSYPAFYLSGFSPLMVLKNKLSPKLEGFWLRRVLVVFQFSISIIFIVGLFVINQQLSLIQTKNLGYNRDNVISFQWKGNLYNQWNGLSEGKSNKEFYAFMDGLNNIPGVVSSSNMSGNILNRIYKQNGVTWNGQQEGESYTFASPIVGHDYIETLGIELVAGRGFSKEFNDDYSKVILNESAVKVMGFENPVGEVLNIGEVIGVVKDFHYGSLYKSLDPLIFRCDINGGNIMVKIQSGTEKTTLTQLEEHYTEFLQGYDFEYSFLDEDYQALYEAENKVSVLSTYFAGLAIIISCLGLLGLAAFTAERRQKEIGIRKILGAGTWRIVGLLSTDFTKMIIIAILIALPISYKISENWLLDFAVRIDLQWWYFISGAMIALAISWFTIGYQAFKSANINPADCLRDE